MPKLFFELQRKAQPALRDANLAECERIFCAALNELEESPYHLALDLHFLNSPSLVAEYFNQCFNTEARPFEIGAAYTEMNGFDINTRRWYGDIFVYRSYGGHNDYDWLAFPDASGFPDFTLVGMEPLQAAFASPEGLDEKFSDARDVTGLLVVVRFQQLISGAAAFIKHLDFPLLSTAHDYDFIAEVAPGQTLF